MLYTFLKDTRTEAGNIIMVGDIDAPTLEAKIAADYPTADFVPVDAAEYFQQEVGVLNARIAELETTLPPSEATGSAT